MSDLVCIGQRIASGPTRRGRFGLVGHIDSVGRQVLNANVLGPEPARHSGSIECCAQDGRLVRVDILGDLVLADLVRNDALDERNARGTADEDDRLDFLQRELGRVERGLDRVGQAREERGGTLFELFARDLGAEVEVVDETFHL